MPNPRPRRMVTAKTAVRELGVKKSTVYAWIADSDPAEVFRERMRIPDDRGHMRLTLVVDLEQLRDYGDRHALD